MILSNLSLFCDLLYICIFRLSLYSCCFARLSSDYCGVDEFCGIHLCSSNSSNSTRSPIRRLLCHCGCHISPRANEHIRTTRLRTVPFRHYTVRHIRSERDATGEDVGSGAQVPRSRHVFPIPTHFNLLPMPSPSVSTCAHILWV